MITPRQTPTPDDVAAHYDALDDFYRDTWGHHVHHGYWESGHETPEEAAAHLTHVAVNLLALPAENAGVLDIGCGYGETSWHLAESHRAFVTGFTLSEVQKREAENRRSSSPDTPVPDFRLRDWLENELPDDIFDAAISIECISHVANKQKFFTEIHRTLKPGARLVLCAWLAKEDATPWQRRYLLEPICHDGRLPGLGTMAEYRSFITRSGLQLVEATDIGPRVAKTWSVIFCRLVKKVLTDRAYTRLLLDNLKSDRIFALTILRLLLAYKTHSLGYLLLVAQKPPKPGTE